MKMSKSYIVPAIIGVLIVAIAAYVIFGDFSGPGNSKLSIEDSPVLGEESAPVIIYEFTDFSCPFCAAAEGKNAYLMGVLESRAPGWEAPLPAIKEKYVDTGKVKIVFKYFPGHGAATAAHAVALGLYAQNPDLFWKFADVAFANQQNLNDITLMKVWAKNLGADEKVLSDYLESGDYESQLKAEEDMGKINGVTGTPSFFINGQQVVGAQSFSELEKIIEQELAK
jgi:protein-disulfide isomerase